MHNLRGERARVHNILGGTNRREMVLVHNIRGGPKSGGALAVLSGVSTGIAGLDLYVSDSWKVPLLVSSHQEERVGRSP